MGRQLRLPLWSPFGQGRAGNAVHEMLPQLNGVKEIHAHTVERSNSTVEENKLMHMYVKRGRLLDARHVFDHMIMHDVVSWNIMILGYAKQEERVQALDLYARMQQEGVQPSDRTFVSALKACSSFGAVKERNQVDRSFEKIVCLQKGRTIHHQAVKSGFELDVFVGSSLVDMYAKSGNMEDAQRVFDELPYHDVVTWTAMISGYSKQEEGLLALDLYARMQQQGIQPDQRTFVCSLKACSSLAALEEGKHVDVQLVEIACLQKGRGIHSHVVKSGLESNVFVGTTLVDMYAKCGSMDDAQGVFEDLPHRDVVTWTTMISGYSKQEEGALALDLYVQMQQDGVTPDHQTFVGALNACSSLAVLEEGNQVGGKKGLLEKGRAIHYQVVRNCFQSDTFLGTTLVDMYTKCGSMEDARCVFDKMPHRDLVSWNAMILGYSKQDEGALALDMYAQMHQEGVTPGHRTFLGALKGCSSLAAGEEEKQAEFVKPGCLTKGRMINSHIVKSGFELDVFVGTTLVDMYAKCGSMEDAGCVFKELTHRNVVTWTSMIAGYGEQGRSEDALKLYAELIEQGLAPSSSTFVALLKACGNIAALEIGKELHCRISRLGFENTANVATCLIDMYAKCGNMIDALRLFDAVPMRDVVPWNALIAGFARQGESEIVFQILERMLQEGIEPNKVTFLIILTVCSHVGLLDKGQKYFQAMSNKYSIPPDIEHYTCMIDLLGRSGRLDEAVTMVEKMPFQPTVVVWLTVLGACQKWKNVEVGRQAFKNLLKLDVKFSAAYVLMSNIYADANMEEDHDKIEVLRKNAETWILPEESWWAELGGMVYYFGGVKESSHCP